MRNIGAHILFTVVANFFFFQSTIQAALQVDSDPLVYHMEGRHGGEAGRLRRPRRRHIFFEERVSSTGVELELDWKRRMHNY